MSHYFVTTIVFYLFNYCILQVLYAKSSFHKLSRRFFFSLFVFFFSLDPPSASEKCHTIRAAEGSLVSLSCPTDGNPAPAITWYKGSGIYGTMLSSGKDLKFSKVMSNNSGWYTCSANNSLGTVSVSLYLLVGRLLFRVLRQYLTYCLKRLVQGTKSGGRRALYTEPKVSVQVVEMQIARRDPLNIFWNKWKYSTFFCSN